MLTIRAITRNFLRLDLLSLKASKKIPTVINWSSVFVFQWQLRCLSLSTIIESQWRWQPGQRGLAKGLWNWQPREPGKPGQWQWQWQPAQPGIRFHHLFQKIFLIDTAVPLFANILGSTFREHFPINCAEITDTKIYFCLDLFNRPNSSRCKWIVSPRSFSRKNNWGKKFQS